ncbi:class C sortase [Peptostreptococcus porci]|uniref:class C sortase n=1 Tax=Peptostreptococcus porci TaxID=2652282 RepID=UPI0023F32AA3|nr:class C sortase [Peptostreptococcus porci]MDD7183191.1 class C sortase [Peptostreptococcus porci]MDY4129296.1 class C sortase [Peptostreptococcus porci]MDY5964580.1 class C sortase [Peptostreptococcus porci]
MDELKRKTNEKKSNVSRGNGSKGKYSDKKKNTIFVLMFLFGFLILMYPLVSKLYYRVESNFQVQEFEKAKEEFPTAEIKKKIQLAQAYNTTLDPSKMVDAFSSKQKAGIAEYARMLEVKEKIGHIEIPKIDQDLPIYAGTSEEVLQKGAGHLEGTSLPIGGKGTHTVITAHRGLPTAQLFTNLDKLEKGDVFYVHNIEKTLAYKVDRILTVEPSNFEPVLVTKGDDFCTLLTCTPYMINSHRLLVRGHRIPYVASEHKKAEAEALFYRILKLLLIVLCLLILFYFVYRYIKKRRKKKKENIKKEC